MKIFVTFFFIMSLLSAKDYALTIGLNNKSLKGAVNDAYAIAKILGKHEILNTISLYDEKATRENILHNLEIIVNKIQKGDSFYLFFSGHGTSLYDPSLADKLHKDNRLKMLLENSGALIPWDFTEQDISGSIISAKRDLAPFFRKIDEKGAFALVMIDACFSGSSFKELNFSNELPIAVEPHFGEESYPYENIIYLASTSASDRAVEDKSQKPYRGYFSRALEKCLDKHKRLIALKICLEKSEMPQSVVVYPQKKDFYLFDNYN